VKTAAIPRKKVWVYIPLQLSCQRSFSEFFLFEITVAFFSFFFCSFLLNLGVNCVDYIEVSSMLQKHNGEIVSNLVKIGARVAF